MKVIKVQNEFFSLCSKTKLHSKCVALCHESHTKSQLKMKKTWFSPSIFTRLRLWLSIIRYCLASKRYFVGIDAVEKSIAIKFYYSEGKTIFHWVVVSLDILVVSGVFHVVISSSLCTKMSSSGKYMTARMDFLVGVVWNDGNWKLIFYQNLKSTKWKRIVKNIFILLISKV